VPARKVVYLGSLIMLPVMYLIFYAVHLLSRGRPMEESLKWDALLLLATIIGLEQIFKYKYAVPQRSLLTRDIIANVVNKYVTGAVTALIVLPVLLFVPEHVLGRKFFLASPGQLGSFWLQVAVILVSVSFFRYWMHRWQHSNEFLWSLHSYHHRVTDLTALNTDVSNPLDFALRNVVIFLMLGVVGFDPLAILLTVPATNVSAGISHWGADVKGGFLNYVFVTPEVHRWHHSAKVPDGHKYSVNYGVEFAFWDILFGTYHLPQKNGQAMPPERIGHPSGLGDEPNYLKLLLLPLGLYPPSWFKRGPQPAE
jgi:sterol desaturase/sphingolipid hydroxylase (fatty acid hydroxylase superfamily)